MSPRQLLTRQLEIFPWTNALPSVIFFFITTLFASDWHFKIMSDRWNLLPVQFLVLWFKSRNILTLSVKFISSSINFNRMAFACISSLISRAVFKVQTYLDTALTLQAKYCNILMQNRYSIFCKYHRFCNNSEWFQINHIRM